MKEKVAALIGLSGTACMFAALVWFAWCVPVIGLMLLGVSLYLFALGLEKS